MRGKMRTKAHEQGADGMQITASHPEGYETAESGEIRLNCGEGGSSTEATEYRGATRHEVVLERPKRPVILQ